MNYFDSVAGWLVGVLVGLTGVGGGALMTPVLVLFFGMAPTSAVGTDLWFAALTKIAGGAVHQKYGSIDWQVFRRLATGSVPASALVLIWLSENGGLKLTDGITVRLLGAVLLFTSVVMMVRGRLFQLGRVVHIKNINRFRKLQPGLTVIAGAVLGVLVSLTSVGAGALGAMMLIYIYPHRMSRSRLIGTDLVHAIPLTMLAGLGHWAMGHVDFGLLIRLLLGSIPGVLMGGWLSIRLPECYGRVAISMAMASIGANFLLAPVNR